MGCCGATSVDELYLPLNERLVAYGKDTMGVDAMIKYPGTKIWVFTFVDFTTGCLDCQEKLAAMVNWFNDYGLFDNPINNVKWIFEDEMEKNLIVNDIGITKSPTHYFCNEDGSVIDIVPGFPSPEWLEKYILPLVNA
jgi:hypothetical protein